MEPKIQKVTRNKQRRIGEKYKLEKYNAKIFPLSEARHKLMKLKLKKGRTGDTSL